jgi:DNA (cytosine-5)-methyltransferase 1
MKVSPSKKLHIAGKRGYLRTIDLFAGCGGMSLGFERHGFKAVAAVEINDIARNSHLNNFGRLAPSEGLQVFSDVTSVKPPTAVRHLLNGADSTTESVIDIVIGGPPCQAFSRLGRAALWRLAGRDHAHGEDERASMYSHFLSYVSALQPVAFVMENVREIGKFVGRNVAEEIAATTDDMGYETRYAILNAVWFGVPQLRERMFIVGIRKELEITPTFPAIKHRYDIPTGYSTSRSGSGHFEVLAPYDHYVDHAECEDTLSPAVTAEEAFYDLPPIFEHLDGRKGKGHRRINDERFAYRRRNNEFTKEMKNWPGFESDDSFNGHVIRYTPRDYETFRRMPPGGMYPEALETATAIFEERLVARQKELGRKIRRGEREWKELHKATVPPYKVHRYPNKFRKMWADHPARTVPAHIGKDAYSHIHFDSHQARGISMREAARLQSFPDAFHFDGSMNSQLTQIGNAVPPLLAAAVAGNLKNQLMEASGVDFLDYPMRAAV